MSGTTLNLEVNSYRSCPVLRKLEQIASRIGIESIKYTIKEVNQIYFIRYHKIQLKDGTDIVTEQSDDIIHHASVLVNGRQVRVEAFGEVLDLEPLLKTLYGLFELDRKFA